MLMMRVRRVSQNQLFCISLHVHYIPQLPASSRLLSACLPISNTVLHDVNSVMFHPVQSSRWREYSVVDIARLALFRSRQPMCPITSGHCLRAGRHRGENSSRKAIATSMILTHRHSHPGESVCEALQPEQNAQMDLIQGLRTPEPATYIRCATNTLIVSPSQYPTPQPYPPLHSRTSLPRPQISPSQPSPPPPQTTLPPTHSVLLPSA